MILTPRLRVEAIDATECMGLLADGGIAHIGTTLSALPAVVPVPFVVSDDERIIFRAREDRRLTTTILASPVAFEVDSIAETGEGWVVAAVGTVVAAGRDTEAAEHAHLPYRPNHDAASYLEFRPHRLHGHKCTLVDEH